MSSSLVFIIDPSASSQNDDVIIKKHIGTIEQLCKSVASTIVDLFNGWAPKFSASKCVVVRIAGMPYSRFRIN
jgi:hypothetical protein